MTSPAMAEQPVGHSLHKMPPLPLQRSSGSQLSISPFCVVETSIPRDEIQLTSGTGSIRLKPIKGAVGLHNIPGPVSEQAGPVSEEARPVSEEAGPVSEEREEGFEGRAEPKSDGQHQQQEENQETASEDATDAIIQPAETQFVDGELPDQKTVSNERFSATLTLPELDVNARDAKPQDVDAGWGPAQTDTSQAESTPAAAEIARPASSLVLIPTVKIAPEPSENAEPDQQTKIVVPAPTIQKVLPLPAPMHPDLKPVHEALEGEEAKTTEFDSNAVHFSFSDHPQQSEDNESLAPLSTDEEPLEQQDGGIDELASVHRLSDADADAKLQGNVPLVGMNQAESASIDELPQPTSTDWTLAESTQALTEARELPKPSELPGPAEQPGQSNVDGNRRFGSESGNADPSAIAAQSANEGTTVEPATTVKSEGTNRRKPTADDASTDAPGGQADRSTLAELKSKTVETDGAFEPASKRATAAGPSREELSSTQTERTSPAAAVAPVLAEPILVRPLQLDARGKVSRGKRRNAAESEPANERRAIALNAPGRSDHTRVTEAFEPDKPSSEPAAQTSAQAQNYRPPVAVTAVPGSMQRETNDLESAVAAGTTVKPVPQVDLTPPQPKSILDPAIQLTPLYMRSAQVRSLTVAGELRDVRVGDTSVCQAVVAGPNQLKLIGAGNGVTQLVVWAETSDPNRPMRMRAFQVHVDRIDPDVQDGGRTATLLMQSIGNAFPNCRVALSHEAGELIVSGICDSRESAERIIRMVRKTCLVPVQDRLIVR